MLWPNNAERAKYTIGWIAPMPIELSPALALLDSVTTLHVAKDSNIYKAGKIGDHHVVMVTLNKIGLGGILSVTERMYSSFRELKHLLLVGLGGGIPEYAHGEQMVLGDVVVSMQVEHLDCGRRTPKGFEFTHQTYWPSPDLLKAVNTLRSTHLLNGTRVPQILQGIREKLYQNIRNNPEDLGPDADHLFDPGYHHQDDAKLCENCCDTGNSKSRQDRGRKAYREKDTPLAHYGTIGSGNSLVVGSKEREHLYGEFGTICFEMEAAALMDYRCLVIRGISDYSDSHKNKAWQPYAAATAAAYAQELIMQLPAPVHDVNIDRFQTLTVNNEETSPSQDRGPVDTTGLCLLSLDGGGVRGLSTLYILKSIFRQLNHERSITHLPPVKPCDVFDLIGGTSTGGLLALMLGRLKMDVDECISCYTELMRRIFATRTSRIPVAWRGKTEGRFDSSTLRSAIEEVITKYGFSKREPLEEQNAPGCKVFVCATASETTGTTRLRNYTPPEEFNISSTICEAALATSATTSFFQPVHIGARKFVDGALKANNPAAEVEDEASSIWYNPTVEFKSLVKCFVSIGTGHPGKKPIEDNAAKFLAKTLVDIVTETESTAESFINRWRQQHETKRYFRFNVHQGLQDVGLEEHDKQGTIEAVTYEYVGHAEQKSRVRDCVQNLKTKQNKAKANFAADLDEYNTRRIITLHKGEARLSHAMADRDYRMLTTPGLESKTGHVHWTVYRSRNPLFTGRDDILRELELAIRDVVKDSSSSKQYSIVISGIGGQGKSEICLQLAYRVRQIFWGVFWVDVSSTTSAKNDFLIIAKKLGIHAESMEEARQGLANVKEPWLLVLDNADDPEIDYQCYFPAGLLGVVMMTSRNRECHRYASTPAVELEGLSESDARELLLHATDVPQQQWHTFQDDAQEVATLLQSHPLALIQAGAYISRAHCTIAEYPRVFKHQRKRLLKFRPKQAKSRYGDVYATFEASATLLQESQAEAAQDALQLLSMLGMCAASRIPLQRLFEEGWKGAQIVSSSTSSNKDYSDILDTWHVSHLPWLLKADADAWDPFRLVEAIGLLNAFSLVSADTHDDLLSVSMHPLTSAWALDRLGAAAQHNAWLATGCLMAVANHDHMLGYMLWKLVRQLQPHLEALTSFGVEDMFASEPPVKISSMITRCGWLLHELRDDVKLKDLMDNLMLYLNMDPLIVDVRWLPVYDLLASSLRSHGKALEAVSLLEQVVDIKKQILAEDDYARLFSEHTLACAYIENEQVERAVSLLEQVVQVEEQILAMDDSARLASQHELARAYQANGQIEKAVSVIEQVVQVEEQTIAENHPDRLASQSQLAVAYEAVGQVEKAVALLQHNAAKSAS
ncbi:MAG: hypothetical protein Q9204_005667 [Flavoplaca sp. TL-2023a]